MTLPVGREKVQVGADREIKVPLNVRGQGFAGLVRKKKPLLSISTQGDCESYDDDGDELFQVSGFRFQVSSHNP